MGPPAARHAHRSLQMWQFDHSLLSSLFDSGDTMLPPAPAATAAPSSISLGASCAVVPTRDGTCHAVVAWVDFGFEIGDKAGLHTLYPLQTCAFTRASPDGSGAGSSIDALNVPTGWSQ